MAAAAGADRAALVAVGDDGANVTSALGDLTPADWPDQLGGGVIRRVARGNDPIAVEVSGTVSDAEGPFASALLIPVRGEPTVVLGLFRREGGFAVTELERNASLGALLGDLHEESRSRLRASSELENMRERIRTVDDLRPALAQARDAPALAHAAAVAIAERFHAEATSVMLLAPNGELRVAGSIGLSPQVVRDARRRVGEGISGWVAERGRGVLLRGPVEDARFHGVDPDAEAALSVPLRVGDEIVGVLNVKRPRAGTTFDESHLRALEAVAGDVASALRQVEALERLEDDRRRAVAIAEIARLAQAGDRHTAARLACEALGYAAAACYEFPDKKLSSIHYRHPNPQLPKLFISQLKTWELPLPATYVVASDGRVLFAEVFADFKRRPEPQAVLAALARVIPGLLKAAPIPDNQ